jgi:hypothetical protein
MGSKEMSISKILKGIDHEKSIFADAWWGTDIGTEGDAHTAYRAAANLYFCEFANVGGGYE